MPVIVTHEQPNEDGSFYDTSDACHVCHKLTRWWWGNGCVALCPACALTTTHKEMKALATKTNFGPIPSWSTNAPTKPAFDVGSVIELPDGKSRKVLWFWQPESAGLQVVYESIVPRIRNREGEEYAPGEFAGRPYTNSCNYGGFKAWARKGVIV
jgi:hypothetical protein